MLAYKLAHTTPDILALNLVKAKLIQKLLILKQKLRIVEFRSYLTLIDHLPCNTGEDNKKRQLF